MLEVAAICQTTRLGRAARAIPFWSAPNLPPVGESLVGRFRLLRQLGEGGMGAVFEAFDVVAGARLAVKVLRPAAIERPDAMVQLRRELLLARAVTHPNVCRLYDLHLHQARSVGRVPFLTLEFLPGQTLCRRLARAGPLGLAEALRVATQVIAGLAAAHAAGVVHRDLKPSNVVLVPTGFADDVRAVLTDFGIARARIDGAPAALLAASVSAGPEGTREYMAPEQADDGLVTPSSDIYALGVLLHEMVTGQRPSPGLNGNPRPSPRLASGWRCAVESCLRREPSSRPREVGEVLRLLGAEHAC
jgi:eukaryotic-like serine/threonine-protein kinase